MQIGLLALVNNHIIVSNQGFQVSPVLSSILKHFIHFMIFIKIHFVILYEITLN